MLYYLFMLWMRIIELRILYYIIHIFLYSVFQIFQNFRYNLMNKYHFSVPIAHMSYILIKLLRFSFIVIIVNFMDQ